MPLCRQRDFAYAVTDSAGYSLGSGSIYLAAFYLSGQVFRDDVLGGTMSSVSRSKPQGRCSEPSILS